jgi:hypothetical protein
VDDKKGAGGHKVVAWLMKPARGKLVDCCFADDEQEAVSCSIADEQEAKVEGTGGYKIVAWL